MLDALIDIEKNKDRSSQDAENYRIMMMSDVEFENYKKERGEKEWKT